jgi:hypothetical protein
VFICHCCCAGTLLFHRSIDNFFQIDDLPQYLKNANVTAVCGGPKYGLALLENGKLEAFNVSTRWANEAVMQIPIAYQGQIQSISCACRYVIARLRNGTTVTWGKWNSDTETLLQATSGPVAAVSTDSDYTILLLPNGTVVQSPLITNGEPVPADARVSPAIAVAAGGKCAAVLLNTGSVVAWGLDDLSGVADPVYSNVPEEARNGNVQAISAGAGHLLALNSTNGVIQWGYMDVPVPAAAQEGVVAISAGNGYSLALKASGEVIAWGDGTFDNSHCNLTTSLPDQLKANIVGISAGYEHALAWTSNGSLIVWGCNDHGQMDVPAPLNSSTAREHVISAAAAATTSLKRGQSVALLDSGRAVGWGSYFSDSIPRDAQFGIKAVSVSNEVVTLLSNGSVAWSGPYNNLPAEVRAGRTLALSSGDEFYMAIVQPSGEQGLG